MKTTQKKVRKVVTTLAITKEAQDIIFDNGYASQRTVGVFLSQLIVDYHAKQTRKLTTEELLAEIHRLVDELSAPASG
jgi:ABC-type uncharacterized transport system ATPase component